MQMRYRIFLTIKLLISHHVCLRGGEVVGLALYFLYLCLFVVVYMVNRNGCTYVLSRVKVVKISLKWLTPAVHNQVNSEPCLTRLLRLFAKGDTHIDTAIKEVIIWLSK